MHPFRVACRDGLAKIRQEGRYRSFTPLRKDAARFPVFSVADGAGRRDVTVWSSNDYLAMGAHPVVIAAAVQAAQEMGAGIKTTSGPAIERVGDFGSILTNLSDGDILFIDEIHRLNKSIEEILYPAMEDYKLDIIIGKGPSARTIQLDLPKFTLIGATTKLGSISNPLRNRFGAVHRLEFYANMEIEKILERSAKILDVSIEKTGLEKIAACARQTPRVANRLLKRVRDFAQIKNHAMIDSVVANEALAMIDVDHQGLEPADNQILRVIIEKFGGGPVGLGTIAAATSEEIKTVEDVYEPYLIQLGFLARTPRGRIATEAAYQHLGIQFDSKENKLF